MVSISSGAFRCIDLKVMAAVSTLEIIPKKRMVALIDDGRVMGYYRAAYTIGTRTHYTQKMRFALWLARYRRFGA